MKNITASLDQFWIASSICLCGVAIAHPGIGQIVPDATQPVNSIVNTDGNNLIITGGTTAGSNLFHSFQEFSLPTGTNAFFNNSLSIDNIITRVTGGNISNIDGIIGTNGTANLFLLNPNGIIFGSNAALNIGGSFFASTARSMTFSDGSEYSATNPQAPPLLNVNIPIGLQLGENPGTIVNRSLASFNDRVVGLAVQPGQTLGLIGGNLNLAGGHINAIQGKVELAAIVNGEWSLSGENQSSVFFGQAGDRVGDIQLSQQAIVNSSGLGGGEIQITGGLISLDGQSQILANTGGDIDGVGINIEGDRITLENGSLISASTFGAGAAGPINITAGEVAIIGSGNSGLLQGLLQSQFSPDTIGNGLFGISGGIGAASNITLNVDRLTLQDEAAILTSSLASGVGGTITVNASDSVEVLGASLLVSGSAQIGPAGDININTNLLRVGDGSLVSTASSADSQGRGGDLTVNASNLVEVSNVPPGRPVPGGLFTTTLGAGDAGDLTLTTRQLVLRDGAQVNSSSSGAGVGGNLTVNASESIELNGVSPDAIWFSGLYTVSALLEVQGLAGTSPAGNLTVNTGQLIVRNGGRVSAATGGQGSAGSLQINASELVEVTGLGNTTILARREPSALFANTRGEGEAGDLLIQTGDLIVSDRALIAVNGQGAGDAGNLQVSAESVQLNNGALSAATASGEGGNIFLNSQLLQLRENSNISTEAGGSGNGGNITINSNMIAALENSDIIANASQGFGGRVIINSQGIFGTEFRERQTPKSDITATSQLGPQFSGVVDINTPDVEPSAGLVELQTNVVDVQSLLDRDICAAAGSDFYITGRGGLSTNPDQPLSGHTVWVDDRASANSVTVNSEVLTVDRQPIIEATGWAIAPNGQIILTANGSSLTNGPEGWRQHPNCTDDSQIAPTN